MSKQHLPSSAQHPGQNEAGKRKDKGASFRRRLSGTHDCPPLLSGGRRSQPVEHRRVSLKWLAGTVITGSLATLLMVGALYAAVDGQEMLARPPASPNGSVFQLATAPDGSVSKSDRWRRVVEPVSARRVIEISTVSRDGDMERVRLRPFARIIASLALTTGNLAASAPSFNPLSLYAGNDELPDVGTETIYAAEVDGEVALRTTPFPLSGAPLNNDVAFDDGEALAAVRAAARFVTPDYTGGNALAATAFAPMDAFVSGSDGPLGAIDAFASVRIVPENVTQIGKVEGAGMAGPVGLGVDEVILPVRNGDTLDRLLIDNGATQNASELVVRSVSAFLPGGQLREGQRVRVAFAPGAEEGTLDPVRISLYADRNHLFTISLDESGHYLIDEEPSLLDPSLFDEQMPISGNGGARLYESIYETALANGIPMALVGDLIRIFAFDVDYQRPVGPGDSIEVLYALEDDGETPTGEIVYAAITHGETTRHYYRFRAEDGEAGYFDADGESARKFLLRRPVTAGTFRSGFGMRRHPVLGYSRMHNGADWAAPRGTPIMAAGDGVIEEAGWKSGYGRWIRIRHANGYETGYAHQTNFARGIDVGVRVRQGQIIGYVGSTGLSTGPHLHFEVFVNGRNVDPMRIRVGRDRTLDGEDLSNFQTERERVDEIMARDRAPTVRMAGANG